MCLACVLAMLAKLTSTASVTHNGRAVSSCFHSKYIYTYGCICCCILALYSVVCMFTYKSCKYSRTHKTPVQALCCSLTYTGMPHVNCGPLQEANVNIAKKRAKMRKKWNNNIKIQYISFQFSGYYVRLKRCIDHCHHQGAQSAQ